MPDIPTYIVTVIVGEGAPSWATYIHRPSRSPRRIVSWALPARRTKVEALYDLQKWLEKHIAKGDSHNQLGQQYARVKAEYEALALAAEGQE